ncbi:MAG: NUDIX domain-containing protein [Stigonema ocellatum SAG 48.90 = DSM 106950]|nr:NUDIX domain-containing protein [Stigonema ocellatum SAG 48.90 = DSM 106950]
MKMEFLSDLINYSKKYPSEIDKVNEVLSFVNNKFWWSRDNLKGHVTGSAFVIDGANRYILLNHHKKLNRWLHFGGHCEVPNVLSTAIKECEEETTLKEITLFSSVPLDIDIHEIPEHKGVPKHKHYDIRYLFLSNINSDFVISAESNDIKWVKFEELEKYANDESLIRMRDKIES